MQNFSFFSLGKLKVKRDEALPSDDSGPNRGTNVPIQSIQQAVATSQTASHGPVFFGDCVLSHPYPHDSMLKTHAAPTRMKKSIENVWEDLFKSNHNMTVHIT